MTQRSRPRFTLDTRPVPIRPGRGVAAWARLWALAALLAFATGCATVPLYQRERLIDPIMSFKAEAKKDARKTKTLDAREGSTGGNGGAGGGCACN